MMTTEERENPVARALDYPYPREPQAVLFDPGSGPHAAAIVDIGPEREQVVQGIGRPLAVRAVAVAVERQVIEIEHAVALIAAGSNGSAVQLARKWRQRRSAPPILIAPARISGAVSVYSAHLARYGSVPATMHRPVGAPREGAHRDAATADLPVLFLPAEELGHMNATEALGVNYVLAAPDGVTAEIGPVSVAGPLAYVSKRGALALDGDPVLLPETGGHTTGYRPAGQREMIARVQRHAGDEGLLEDFIARIIADEAARKAIVETLPDPRHRWRLDRHEIVADGS